MLTLNLQIRRLPSCPGVARMVLELCRQGASDLGLVADVLMADPAMAARILRFANAPGLSTRGNMTSVRDAVLSLGLRASSMAALGFILPDDIQDRCPRFDLRAYWSESLLRAAVARHVVAPSLCVNRESAFTAALLGTIGQLALAFVLPNEYNEILGKADSPAAQRALERERFGMDYAAAGANLLANWGLPTALADSVASGTEVKPPPNNPLARLVFESQALIDAARGEEGANLEQVCDRLGISREAWDAAIEAIDQDYQTTIDLFDEQICPAEAKQLLSDAQRESATMATMGPETRAPSASARGEAAAV